MEENCQHEWMFSCTNVKIEGCEENPVQTMNINMKEEVCDNAETNTIVKNKLCEMCDNEEGAANKGMVESELYVHEGNAGNPSNGTLKSEMCDNDEIVKTTDINVQNEVHADGIKRRCTNTILGGEVSSILETSLTHVPSARKSSIVLAI